MKNILKTNSKHQKILSVTSLEENKRNYDLVVAV